MARAYPPLCVPLPRLPRECSFTSGTRSGTFQLLWFGGMESIALFFSPIASTAHCTGLKSTRVFANTANTPQCRHQSPSFWRLEAVFHEANIGHIPVPHRHGSKPSFQCTRSSVLSVGRHHSHLAHKGYVRETQRAGCPAPKDTCPASSARPGRRLARARTARRAGPARARGRRGRSHGAAPPGCRGCGVLFGKILEPYMGCRLRD